MMLLAPLAKAPIARIHQLWKFQFYTAAPFIAGKISRL
jgi:hypothetical protein